MHLKVIKHLHHFLLVFFLLLIILKDNNSIDDIGSIEIGKALEINTALSILGLGKILLQETKYRF